MKQLSIKIIMSVFMLSSLLFLVPGSAAAHVLKQDNGISGVLHIPPDDNPSAGAPTELGMSFASDTNNFSLSNCTCKVTVKQDGQVVQTTSLAPALSGATLEAAATVTFPSVAVYDVIVSGLSTDDSFHDFTLDYEVRVAGEATGTARTQNSNGGTDILIVSVASIAIVGIVAYAAIRNGGRYANIVSKPQKIRRKQ